MSRRQWAKIMSRIPTFKPVNRHMLIVPHFPEKQKENSAVLLPEGYEPDQERYILATVVDIAPDCAQHFRALRGSAYEDKTVVVDRGMIEKISVKKKTNYLVLENYVVGILNGAL